MTLSFLLARPIRPADNVSNVEDSAKLGSRRLPFEGLPLNHLDWDVLSARSIGWNIAKGVIHIIFIVLESRYYNGEPAATS